MFHLPILKCNAPDVCGYHRQVMSNSQLAAIVGFRLIIIKTKYAIESLVSPVVCLSFNHSFVDALLLFWYSSDRLAGYIC